jgi:3-hydroxymyristoyl/3-hydroxydecanoyl-(acyl carrier protein) dehydratase
LSEPLFQRLFAHLAVPEDSAGIESPYTNPVPLSWSEPTSTTIVARNGGLPPRHCAGHFRGYPAWPVAIIVACMLRTVEKLLKHVLQSPVQWLMDSCTVEAFELVAAATPVTFSTTYLGVMAESQHKFTCVASAGNDICARVVTAIRVVASDVGSVEGHMELASEISESG